MDEASDPNIANDPNIADDPNIDNDPTTPSDPTPPSDPTTTSDPTTPSDPTIPSDPDPNIAALDQYAKGRRMGAGRIMYPVLDELYHFEIKGQRQVF